MSYVLWGLILVVFAVVAVYGLVVFIPTLRPATTGQQTQQGGKKSPWYENQNTRMWIGCLFGGILIHVMLIYTLRLPLWKSVVLTPWSLIGHAVVLFWVLNGSGAGRTHLNHKVRYLVIWVFSICTLIVIMREFNPFSLFTTTNTLAVGQVKHQLNCIGKLSPTQACVLDGIEVTYLGSDIISPFPEEFWSIRGSAKANYRVMARFDHPEGDVRFVSDGKEPDTAVRHKDKTNLNTWPRETMEFRLPKEKDDTPEKCKKITIKVTFTMVPI